MKNSLQIIIKTTGLVCVAICLLLLLLAMYACSRGTLNGKSMSQVARILNGEDITKPFEVKVVPKEELEMMKAERESTKRVLDRKEQELLNVQSVLEVIKNDVANERATLEAERKKNADLLAKLTEAKKEKDLTGRTTRIETAVAYFAKMKPTDVADIVKGNGWNDELIGETLKKMKSSQAGKIIGELKKDPAFTAQSVGKRSRLDTILLGMGDTAGAVGKYPE